MRLRDPGESFTADDAPIGAKLVDYWQWANSVLLDNVQRAVLAEFLVAHALNLTHEPRQEWGAYDLKIPCEKDGGEILIEVKSAAYIQSWHQEQNSRISFGIAPTRDHWDPQTGRSEKRPEPRRPSHIYVFCHFTPKLEQREKADLLDVDQWDFYVLATRELDRAQPGAKSIGLSGLRRLVPEGATSYCGLRERIEQIARNLSDRNCTEAADTSR